MTSIVIRGITLEMSKGLLLCSLVLRILGKASQRGFQALIDHLYLAINLGMMIDTHFQLSTLKFKRIVLEIVGKCGISIQRNGRWDGVQLKCWFHKNMGNYKRCKWV